MIKLKPILVNLDSRAQLLIIGIIVGICSGFAALGLNLLLEVVSHFLHRFHGKLYTVLFPGIGIVLTVIYLKYIVRDFEGHGVPEVIYGVSIKGGVLKLRSVISKLIGSLITISTGGSAGPEAPVVISGASIGSNIASFLKTNDKIRIAATGSGAAAAIASIFNAPIAGIIFTMEVILGEWSTLSMLPVAIASVTGTIISRMFNGNQIPFKHVPIHVNINDIFAAVGLSLLISFFAVIFIKSLKWLHTVLAKIFKHFLMKAFCGGILVGVITIFFPVVKGEGYEVIREIIAGKFSAPVMILLVLVSMKILATSFTLGAGGAGGVFAPSLVIGSLSGYAYYFLLTALFPGAQFSGPTLFALTGMAGILSGTLHAPLTGIFLIVEITGGYDVILPLLLVSFLTSNLVKFFEKHSIYEYELIEKGHLLRPRTDGRILSDIRVDELLEKDLIPIHPEMLLKDLIPLIKKSHRNYFPVEERGSGKFRGMVFLQDIKEYIFDPHLLNSIIVEEIMKTDLIEISLKDNMSGILDKFDATNSWSLPVVENGKFLGLISRATILGHYRKELKAQTES
jgi:CIC family chloride channel protein